MKVTELIELYKQAELNYETAMSDLRVLVKHLDMDSLLDKPGEEFIKTYALQREEVKQRKEVFETLAELDIPVDIQLEPYDSLKWD
jgi:hypothetical protein